MVGDPQLRGAHAAAVLAGAAGVLPVRENGIEHRELVLHDLDVRRAAEGAPREAVGVHAVLGRPRAVPLGVDRVGEHVGERRAPLRRPASTEALPPLPCAAADLLATRSEPNRGAATQLAIALIAPVAAMTEHDVAAARRATSIEFGGNTKSIGWNVAELIGRSWKTYS